MVVAILQFSSEGFFFALAELPAQVPSLIYAFLVPQEGQRPLTMEEIGYSLEPTADPTYIIKTFLLRFAVQRTPRHTQIGSRYPPVDGDDDA